MRIRVHEAVKGDPDNVKTLARSSSVGSLRERVSYELEYLLCSEIWVPFALSSISRSIYSIGPHGDDDTSAKPSIFQKPRPAKRLKDRLRRYSAARRRD